jgi:hypothetical protein
VVVQVARADAQLKGDVRGGDRRFPVPVEQREGGAQDLFRGFQIVNMPKNRPAA